MKLTDIKTEVYEALGVTTTKEVKALYSTRNLTLRTEWETIYNELTTEGETTELYGFPESPVVLTGKTGELTEAFAIATEDEDEWTEPEPIDISEVIKAHDGEPDDTFVTLTMPSVAPEWVEDELPESESSTEFCELPEPNAPMTPIPLALWDFTPGHNLVGILSPWAHYLQWLSRLYSNLFSVAKSTVWGFQNV